MQELRALFARLPKDRDSEVIHDLHDQINKQKGAMENLKISLDRLNFELELKNRELENEKFKSDIEKRDQNEKINSLKNQVSLSLFFKKFFK